MRLVVREQLMSGSDKNIVSAGVPAALRWCLWNRNLLTSPTASERKREEHRRTLVSQLYFLETASTYGRATLSPL